VANSNSTYDCQASIFKVTGGTYAQSGPTTSPFTQIPNSRTDFRVQLTAILDNRFNSNTQFTWRLVVNGKDTGCVSTTQSGQLATGFIGVRSSTVGVANNHFFSQVVAKSRVRPSLSNRFLQGNIQSALTTSGLFLNSNRISFIDIWTAAATAENAYWRKRPGVVQDFIDYDLAPVTSDTNIGRDLRTKVILREGLHIQDFQIEGNLQSLASEVLAAANPGADNNGQLSWIDLSQSKSIGVVPGAITNNHPTLV
jgi:hypothetical protein